MERGIAAPGWVKGSLGMLRQPGEYTGRKEGSYFHLERSRKVKRKEGGREGARRRKGGGERTA